MGGFFYFLFSVIVFIVCYKLGFFSNFGNAAQLFAGLLESVFKLLTGIVNGTYNPTDGANSIIYGSY
jgi:hypothetical protein